MTIAAVCRPIADASVSIAAAYKPIDGNSVGIEIYEEIYKI